MMKILSVKQAVDRLEQAGLHTNVNRLGAGLKAGVYPFGVAFKIHTEYVFEIYSTLLEQWIAERSDPA